MNRFDEDLIAHATLVVCPDAVTRVFAGFDEDGDLGVLCNDGEAHTPSGVLYFEAAQCELSEG